jgi:transcriptional regulator with XRE-family HTH domain
VTRDHSVTKLVYAAAMTDRRLGKHFIREWREYRGLSLRKLADRMESEPGVALYSHAQIGRVETYENAYGQEFLEALAVALDVSVGDLLSTDPWKEGEVIDLVKILKEKGLDKLLQDRDLDLVARVIAELPKRA